MTLEIDRVREMHETFVGGQIFVTETAIVTNDRRFDASIAVDTRLVQEPFRVVGADGKTINKDGQETAIYRMWLRWLNGGWRVAQWERAVS